MERNSGWYSRVACAVALLPCTVAVLVHFVRPPRPLAIELPSRPALAFDQYLVDLGRVTPTSELRATFLFRNRGTQPIDVTDVAPSCGCLVPYVSTRKIEPGKTGRIVLRMQPANELPGRKEFFADVKYTDPQPREARLTFKLELPEDRLLVRPKALTFLFYQSSDQPLTRQIVVTDSREQPARIVDVTANRPFVRVEPGGRSSLESGGVEQRIGVTVQGDVPAGRHEALLTIRTDDPHSPVLRVPLVIERQPAQPQRADE
jgi:hypothetical protein